MLIIPQIHFPHTSDTEIDPVFPSTALRNVSSKGFTFCKS